MTRVFATISLALLATPLLAAVAKDEVKATANKLADSPSYSWRTTTESAAPAGNNRFRQGPTEGKTEKDGYTVLSMTRGDNTTQAVLKGGKGAMKLPDQEWQSLAEAAEADAGGNQFNIARFVARSLQTFKSPAAEAESLADKAKDLKKNGDAYEGDLSEEGAKDLMTFRFRQGGNGPEISNPKGTVKFWVENGVLTKYQFHVQGSMTFNNNDIQIDRTTTTEIKDVGSTKVDVPDGAKKKAE